MTVRDLIKNKDYDYISWRIMLPERFKDESEYEEGVFIGQCRSENGKLISLDGDTIYDEDDVVLKYEEWSNPSKGIYNGLTVVVEDCNEN